MLLRISPDGGNASTQLGSWSSSYSCVPWTAPDNTQGIQCTNSSVPPSLGDFSVITNADQGVAVFVRRDTYGCSVTYADPGNPNVNSLDVCSGDATHNHMDIYYVSQDAISNQVSDAAVFPNNGTPSPGSFIPVLQREDGSYIGNNMSGNTAGSYLMAMGANGGILWQQQFGPASPLSPPVTPLYATAGGGVIATTSWAAAECPPGDIAYNPLGNGVNAFGVQMQYGCQEQGHAGFIDSDDPNDPNFGQLGTLYTLDQNGNTDVDANGNPIPPVPDTGAKPSWTGNWYVDPSPASVLKTFLPAINLAPGFWSTRDANASTNRVAVIKQTLYMRIFAPWFAFGPDPLANVLPYIPGINPCLLDCFRGDNRTFTTAVNKGVVTARINGSVDAGPVVLERVVVGIEGLEQSVVRGSSRHSRPLATGTFPQIFGAKVKAIETDGTALWFAKITYARTFFGRAWKNESEIPQNMTFRQ